MEIDDRYYLMEEYYKKHILNHKIIRIEVGIEDHMFDECCVKAYIGKESHISIPLNLNQFRFVYRKYVDIKEE